MSKFNKKITLIFVLATALSYSISTELAWAQKDPAAAAQQAKIDADQAKVAIDQAEQRESGGEASDDMDTAQKLADQAEIDEETADQANDEMREENAERAESRH